MRYLFLFSFYLVARADVIQLGLLQSDGIELVRETIGPIEDSKDPNTSERIADFACEFNVGLSDDNEDDVTIEDNFVYPCGSNKSSFDYDCIREFFADNSDCCPISGQVPEPLFLAQMTGFFPSINTTGTYENITFEGLSDASVSEFYYNKKTGNVVFAIEVPVIYSKTPKAYFIYRRPGRENIVKSGYSYGAFKSLIFTAIIPSLLPYSKLRLDLADISGYVGDSNPDVNFAPSLTDSTNPVVVAESTNLFKLLPIVLNELYYFQSQLFMGVYIQTNICDFGVKLYSI